MRSFRAALDLLRPGVYAPVYCGRCALHRTHVSSAEARILAARGRVLCPCGGHWTYVGPDIERTTTR